MYQDQERQDELQLNWDSFKWRNYDFAIGRFMNIDPLAEKYSYQSPYNFSENRVIDSRELEGLEAVQSIDGNVINVTVRMKPVNLTEPGGFAAITEEQMQAGFNNFKSQAEKSWSGKNTANQQVNFKIINDPNATLSMYFVPLVDSEGEGQIDYNALGYTLSKDWGNTQTGSFQVSTYGTYYNFGSKNPDDCDCGVGRTASHEFGHLMGFIGHIADAANKHHLSKIKSVATQQIKVNLMSEQPIVTPIYNGKLKGEIVKSREILPSQRDVVLKNIPIKKD